MKTFIKLLIFILFLYLIPEWLIPVSCREERAVPVTSEKNLRAIDSTRLLLREKQIQYEDSIKQIAQKQVDEAMKLN